MPTDPNDTPHAHGPASSDAGKTPSLIGEVVDGQTKQNGGARPGAGRPPGSLSAENKLRQEMRRRFVQRAHEMADEIFDAHMDAALGHYYEQTDMLTGAVRIYKTKPNPSSLEWIMQQMWGMAPQRISVDVTGEEEEGVAKFLTPQQQAALTAAISHAIPKQTLAKSPTVSATPSTEGTASG